MKRIAKQGQEKRQSSAANDNGDPFVRLGGIDLDRWLLAAIDTWVEAQPEPKPPRSEAISMALYQWAIGMGLTPDRLEFKANTFKSMSKTLDTRKSDTAILPSRIITPRAQVAALPIRANAHGKAEVLLITSRETSRWIIPKGWPMKNRNDWDAAAREAREEAGVVGRSKKKPIGTYEYLKYQSNRYELCRVTVYPLIFDHQRKNWPEKGQRECCWFLPSEAAARVIEPGLRVIIESLDTQQPDKLMLDGRGRG